MALYSKNWWYPNGDAATGVRALVFLEDQSTLAEIFADPGFSVPLPNPTATDNTGHLAFYVVDGNYWVYVGDDFSGDSELVAVSQFVTGAVLSVNGQIGIVTLDAFDVGAQPADSELTNLAGIVPSDDDIIQRKAGVWTNRSIAQYKADQNWTAAEVGAIPATIFDAKGDIVAASAADNPIRVSVGVDGTFLRANSAASGGVDWTVPPGGGDVTGPASSGDNALSRFDGLTGKLIQNSNVTLSDIGIFTLPAQGSPPVAVAGQLFYDGTTRTLNFDNDDLNVRLPIGRQVWVQIHNDSAFNLTKGQVVHIDGAQASAPFLPTVEPSLATNRFTNQSIGLVLESIPIGQNGFILVEGLITGINTSALVAGEYAYVSASSVGMLTATQPHSPNFSTIVGVVSKVDAVNGSILVFPSHTELGPGAANQVRGMDSSGIDEEYKTLQGTAGRLTVTHGVGTVTFNVDNALVSGGVQGPAGATDNAIARFDGTSGTLIQNSPIRIIDTAEIIFPQQSLAVSGAAEGQLFYSAGNKTLNFTNDDTSVTLPIGRHVWLEAVNEDIGVITKGMAVRLAGHFEDPPFGPAIQKSLANDENAAQCIGVALQDINPEEAGIVLLQGVISGVDTSAFFEGEVLYVSPTVEGGLTNNRPHQPNFQTPVGVVEAADAVHGAIFVFPSLTLIGHGTSNQYLAVDTGGTNQVYRSLLGTAGRLTVTHSSTAATFDIDNTILNTKVDKSTLSGKGSLISASAAGVPIDLPTGLNGQILRVNTLTPSGLEWATDAFTGDVTGPASAVDNSLTRFDGVTGKLIQSSGMTLSDDGTLTFPSQVSIPSVADGQLYYSAAYKTLHFDNTDPDGTLIIGRQSWIEVRNETGSTISKGSALYATNHQEVFPYPPTVALAQANSATTSRCIGLAAHDIENNTNGYVTIEGILPGYPTVGFNHGDYLYVSPSVAGNITNIRPSSPNFAVPVAIVTAVDISHGTLSIIRTEASLGFGSANQVRGVNAAGTAEEYKTLQGTAGRLTVTQGVGSTTFDVDNTVLNTKTDKATLTAKGSIYAASAPGVPADLPVGMNNQYLMANSATATGLEWDTITPSDIGAIGNSIMDAKGDLISASANDTPLRLGVGANGQLLRANSATPTGLEWATTGTGDVGGPGSSIDNGIPRFDGTTGKLIQGSGITISDLDAIVIPSAPGIPSGAGSIYRLGDDLTFANLPSIAFVFDRQTFMPVMNSTGGSLSTGTAVYVNGNSGGIPTVTPALATSETTSRAIGLISGTIANGATGYVTVGGRQGGINTSGFSNGDPLYVSAVTPGALTNVKPSAPNVIAQVATVTFQNAGGIVDVRPQAPIPGIATNGFFNTYRSGAPTGLFGVPPPTWCFPTQQGGFFYAGGVHITRTQTSPTLNLMHLVPFQIMQDDTLTTVNLEVTGNSGGALVRGGIYGAGTDLKPSGAALFDYGTISAASTGTIAFSVSSALTAGLYYFAIVSQSVTPQLRFTTGFTPFVGDNAFQTGGGAAVGLDNCFTQAGVSGALPTAAVTSTAGAPLIGLQFA